MWTAQRDEDLGPLGIQQPLEVCEEGKESVRKAEDLMAQEGNKSLHSLPISNYRRTWYDRLTVPACILPPMRDMVALIPIWGGTRGGSDCGEVY